MPPTRIFRRPAVLGLIAAWLIGSPIAFVHGDVGLREAANGRFLVGCAIASGDLNNPRLEKLVVDQFNAITPEYELMPEFVVDTQGTFTFERGDRVVQFGQDHRIPVFGHMLVWHFLSRDGLFQNAEGKPLSREMALTNLRKYIHAVVGHYRGRVKAWNVVNEALSDRTEEYLRPTPAQRAIGDDYIRKAFEFAREADPGAELYYNDYNIEQPEKRAKALKLIRSLKAAHAPIDAIGIQGHWLMDYPPTSQIEESIAAFAAEGVKVMITELDVDPLPRTASGADLHSVESGPDPYRRGLPPDIQTKLAKRYGEIVTAILRSPRVTSITFWGTHDGRSWLNDFPVKGRTNHPLLFDRELEPKPAFNAVLRAFEAAGNPPSLSDWEPLRAISGGGQRVF